MRLIRITAENFKGLRLVEWSPRPGANYVAGPNSSGKSSLLDSVIALILGPKFAPERPIRDGEREARVVGEFGEYTLTRVWRRPTPDGEITHTLTVASADGGLRKRPQEIASGFIDSISIDPIAFFRLKPADQRDWLLDAVGLRGDLDRLDGLRKARYEQRRTANVATETLRGQRAAYPADVADIQPVDVSGLLADLKTARAANDAAAAHGRKIDEEEREHTRLHNEITAAEARLRDLRTKLEAASAEITRLHDNLPPVVDLAPIEAAIAGAQEKNAAANAAAVAKALDIKIAASAKAAEDLTGEIATIDAGKAALLASAAWPTPEIGIDDAAVTWNGVPLSQGATNEQIKASIALALMLAKRNPLKLLIVRDANNLTEDSKAAIARQIAEAGVDAYLELAEDSPEPGPACIVLEDGAVAGAEVLP